MVQLSYSCMIGTRTISSFLKSGLGGFGEKLCNGSNWFHN